MRTDTLLQRAVLVRLAAALRDWEHAYNTERPHQALGYPTPAEPALARAPGVTEVPDEYTGFTSAAVGCIIPPYGWETTEGNFPDSARPRWSK